MSKHRSPSYYRGQQKRRLARQADSIAQRSAIGAPDWSRKCENCGATPVVPEVGLCGPCCFGEAETVNGNW